MKKFKRLIRSEPASIIAGLVTFIPALILERSGYDIASLVLFILALVAAGHSVFLDAVKGILRRDLLDEKFLMSIASVGAMIIGEREEGVAVMLFYLLGEWFQHIAVRRSRASIRSLMDIMPDTAVVLTDDGEEEMDAEDVEVGARILVRQGERIPLDARIVTGAAELDTSMLTGESMPVNVTVGDTVQSGCVVLDGVIECITLSTLENSAASRILDMVENASERKSREESFITAFSRVYTPIVTVLALLMATVPPLFKLISFTEGVYRALSFLVVSCPCALVISVPMAFFGGIGSAASHGILYKGGNVFRHIAKPHTFVFDKTGTLTTGRLELDGITLSPDCDIDRDECLRLAASAEYGSTHPIATAIKNAAQNTYPTESVQGITGMGVIATVNSREVAVGNLALLRHIGLDTPESLTRGEVYVAVDGRLAATLSLRDSARPEAKRAIAELRSLGVARTVILSGDGNEKVKRIAEEIGVDSYLGELLPEDKLSKLEEIITESAGSVIYLGDGINDTPALARADVGIAMGDIGSDSAIEVADAVIVADNLERLPLAVRIARKTLAIAKENIALALGVKITVLALVSVNLAGMWMAVFADVGVAVLAILNSMRTLLYGRRTHK